MENDRMELFYRHFGQNVAKVHFFGSFPSNGMRNSLNFKLGNSSIFYD